MRAFKFDSIFVLFVYNVDFASALCDGLMLLVLLHSPAPSCDVAYSQSISFVCQMKSPKSNTNIRWWVHK